MICKFFKCPENINGCLLVRLFKNIKILMMKIYNLFYFSQFTFIFS